DSSARKTYVATDTAPQQLWTDWAYNIYYPPPRPPYFGRSRYEYYFYLGTKISDLNIRYIPIFQFYSDHLPQLPTPSHYHLEPPQNYQRPYPIYPTLSSVGMCSNSDYRKRSFSGPHFLPSSLEPSTK